ncbi:type II secretion system secretin GspD [Hyphomicrobium facile]|nr:type II secretion system secretin GspD [Hyphomicrobium facile]
MAKLSNASLAPASPINRPQYSSVGSSQTVSQKFPGDNRITSSATRQMNAGVSESGSGYELTFNDTELSEFVKVVLKDTLGITYVFDSKVEGRVTLSTGGPVSRTQLISILESVLATYKAVLLIENNVYRVVPEADAHQQGISAFDYVKESREVGAGYGVSIFPLRYVSTDAIMRMLDGLLVKQEDLRASVYNNLLFVRGSSQARQSVVEIISMFDVDWMKGQSAGLFKLNNAAPDDVIRELAQVFQTERQGRGLVKFQPIARLNAILVLAPKSQSIDKAAEWISRLDHGGADDNNFYVYRVENGRAKDLAQLLMAAFSGSSGGSLRGAEEKEVAPTSGASRMGSGGGSGSSFGSSFGSSNGSNSSAGTGAGFASSDTPGSSSSSSGPLKSAPPPAAAADDTSADDSSASSGGSSTSSDQVRITPDERNNKLLIKASERNYRKILQILRRIDQPPLQVLINATLAEVTLNDNLAYGVQFYLQKNRGKAGAIGFSTADALAIAPVAPGLNLIAGAVGSDPRVILDALAQETAVRVVSSPSVVVLHNQPATLEVGDEVPIITRQAQSVINPDSPTVNEIEFKNTGVILNVTPRINSNGLVTMEIQQEVSAVQNPAGQSSSSSTSLTPTISQRRVTSTIAVQSGQMVVLGGLIREEVNRSKSSIPVLNKIPYIGDVLGGDTNNTKVRTELIVFIRPTVIHNPEDASNAAEALRAGMQSLAPRPTAWDVDVQERGAGGQASVIK